MAARLQEFIHNLRGVLDDELQLSGADAPCCSLYIGATGGMREKLAQGQIGEGEVEAIRAGFERSFADRMRVVKFEVITGKQEAAWEYEAAQAIWGGDLAPKMFPAACAGGAAPEIGMFSGGGKSMQLARRGSALSFPFSTFPAELEERQGAAPDAWLDPVKWDRFAEARIPSLPPFYVLRACPSPPRFGASFYVATRRMATRRKATCATDRHLRRVVSECRSWKARSRGPWQGTSQSQDVSLAPQ